MAMMPIMAMAMKGNVVCEEWEFGVMVEFLVSIYESRIEMGFSLIEILNEY